MKYSQNAKILQITENTLIIGVDVASEIHYARAFDYRGIEFGRLLKFSNDRNGFSVFAEWIEKLRAEHQKEHVMVGMEPTGHYWFTFAKEHQIRAKTVQLDGFNALRYHDGTFPLLLAGNNLLTYLSPNKCRARTGR